MNKKQYAEQYAGKKLNRIVPPHEIIKEATPDIPHEFTTDLAERVSFATSTLLSRVFTMKEQLVGDEPAKKGNVKGIDINGRLSDALEDLSDVDSILNTIESYLFGK